MSHGALVGEVPQPRIDGYLLFRLLFLVWAVPGEPPGGRGGGLLVSVRDFFDYEYDYVVWIWIWI